MTPVHLKQSTDLSVDELKNVVPVSRPIGEPVSVMRSKVDLSPDAGGPNVGVWECSPGRWRRQVAEGEFSTFLTGRCTFTPDGGNTIALEAGDSIYFHPDTNGVWDIQETVRKAYIIVSSQVSGEKA